MKEFFFLFVHLTLSLRAYLWVAIYWKGIDLLYKNTDLDAQYEV